MNKTCVHNVMHWARCFECEVDMLNIQLATAETEVARLNKWADGVTDIALKERATGEAYQRELRAKLADAIAFVRKAGHLPGCGVSVCQHRLPSGLSGRCGGTNDQPQHRRVSFAIYKHDFQPGECTCGHDRIVGSERE